MLAAQSKLSLSVRMALRWTRLEGRGTGGQLGLAHERRQRLLGAAALQPPSLMRMCYRGLDGRRSGFLILEQSPYLKCDFPSVIAICINFLLLTTHRRRQSSLLLRLMPACQPARPTVPFLSSGSSCPLRPSPPIRVRPPRPPCGRA